ncbi:MAG: preprotein translocase subunit SecG [Bacteroidales bacterium]|nr:preprotein translocase subunit SecG [Bacteroidales bacterium]MEA4840196.1 preprotein translocase subunit SecG [Bacteroidales bacterium]
MYLLISVIIFIAAIILILIVLVQNSKGGGLASGFSSSNQVMGVRKTTDFLEKATWTLAGVVAFLSIISVGFVHTDEDTSKQSIIKTEVENAVKVDPNLTSPNFGAQQAETETPAQAPAAEKK